MGAHYCFGKRVAMSFEEAILRVTEALKAEGFGILTDIDVAKTMKAKLGIERLPYRILGACNPALAHRALETEPSIGTLLPCNVVVRATPEGEVVVECMDPNFLADATDLREMKAVAREVRDRLERVMESLD